MTDVTVRLKGLAEELAVAGELRSPRWRAVFGRVPRHPFVPAFYREQHTDRGTAWAPSLRKPTTRASYWTWCTGTKPWSRS